MLDKQCLGDSTYATLTNGLDIVLTIENSIGHVRSIIVLSRETYLKLGDFIAASMRAKLSAPTQDRKVVKQSMAKKPAPKATKKAPKKTKKEKF